MWWVPPSTQPVLGLEGDAPGAAAPRGAAPPAPGSRRAGATTGWRGLRVTRRGDEAVGRAAPAAAPPGRPRARSASGSRSRQSASTSEPWRRSRMPALRRRRKDASGRVSGQRRAARRWPSARPARAARPCAASRARPRGARAPTQASPRSAAWWQADRATSPPIEWPTSAICSTSTGQPRHQLPRAGRPARGRSRRCGGRCCSAARPA